MINVATSNECETGGHLLGTTYAVAGLQKWDETSRVGLKWVRGAPTGSRASDRIVGRPYTSPRNHATSLGINETPRGKTSGQPATKQRRRRIIHACDTAVRYSSKPTASTSARGGLREQNGCCVAGSESLVHPCERTQGIEHKSTHFLESIIPVKSVEQRVCTYQCMHCICTYDGSLPHQS